MFGHFADHSQYPASSDYFTLVANWFDACANFHIIPKYLRNQYHDVTKTLLFGAVHNSSAPQIIGGNFKLYLIAWQNPDKMHAHLTTDMGQNLMPVIQLNFKHRVGKGFHDGPLTFDDIFF